ncbi:hypothetical protein NPIL_424801 [Nephila pilipes]|uniref:Uncharacterized protein n=1 Tax=Nephila pilipes TaxID=299642 RepID=A0A8X6QS05_NEPPI|nr:hypothetical protein NPIL_424801 [Nephila pilipes]
MSPYELETQRLRDLLATVESDDDCISEIEDDTDNEMFSGRNTDTEEDDELDHDNSEDFIGKDGKTVWKKNKMSALNPKTEKHECDVQNGKIISAKNTWIYFVKSVN